MAENLIMVMKMCEMMVFRKLMIGIWQQAMIKQASSSHNVTQQYRSKFWWWCPVIWLLHSPESSALGLYNVQLHCSHVWSVISHSHLYILKFCISIRVLFNLITFIKIFLIYHKHSVTSNFWTYRYKTSV